MSGSLEGNEIEAALSGGAMGGEYLESIGQYDMSKMTAEQWETFVCCICKKYHEAYDELRFKP